MFSSRTCLAPTSQRTKSGSGSRKGPPGLEREGSEGGRMGFWERAGGMEMLNWGEGVSLWENGGGGRGKGDVTRKPLWVMVVGVEGP